MTQLLLPMPPGMRPTNLPTFKENKCPSETHFDSDEEMNDSLELTARKSNNVNSNTNISRNKLPITKKKSEKFTNQIKEKSRREQTVSIENEKAQKIFKLQAKLTNKNKASENKKLTPQIVNLKEFTTELQQENKRLQQELEKYKNLSQKNTLRALKSEAENNNLQDTVVDYAIKIEKLTYCDQQQQNDLALQDETIEVLKKENARLEERDEAFINDTIELQSENVRLVECLNTVHTQFELLKEDLTKLNMAYNLKQDEVNKKDQQLQQKANEIIRLKSLHDAFVFSNQVLQNQNQSLVQHNENLGKERARLCNILNKK
jgi:hypothetical protein